MISASHLQVTSFTLVWIKIFCHSPLAPQSEVTSFTLVWIKIDIAVLIKYIAPGHELHARVD